MREARGLTFMLAQNCDRDIRGRKAVEPITRFPDGPARSARSSISIWTLFLPRWSSATIQSYAESRLRSADRASAALSPRKL